VVGLYLAGIIAGRALMPLVLRRLSIERHLVGSLTIAVGGILLFVLVPAPGAKAGLCALYGFGIGPLFPLLLARGAKEFPEQTGAVTGILFAGMSLGGMVFPLLLGVLAARVGIARSYWLSAALACGLLIVAAAMNRTPGSTPAAPAPRPREP
jgi:fucose permease